MKNSRGNNNPKNDIGQNILGLMYTEIFDNSNRNKKREFTKKIILFNIFFMIIYLLLSLNNKFFSSLFKLS